jgi:hypothetical protein
VHHFLFVSVVLTQATWEGLWQDKKIAKMSL